MTLDWFALPAALLFTALAGATFIAQRAKPVADRLSPGWAVMAPEAEAHPLLFRAHQAVCWLPVAALALAALLLFLRFFGMTN
jgi:hypothetical protein